MPETVNLAGKPYPKNAVWVVVAVGGAILGYAWFTKGRTAGVETETDYLVPENVEPTGVLPFGGTQSGVFTESGGGFRSDQEWYKAALDELLFDYGTADTPTASNALDRYLANQPLSTTQVPMMNFVINSIGPPPSGTRTIRQETGTTPPPSNAPARPGTPAGLKLTATQTRVGADWSPTAGAAKYRVDLIAGVSTVVQTDVIPRSEWFSSKPLRRKAPYRVRVWAVNNAGVHSDVPATATIHTQ